MGGIQQWLCSQLLQTLGDAADEVAEYVLSIEDDEDLREYLGDLGVQNTVTSQLLARQPFAARVSGAHLRFGGVQR